MNGNVGIGTWVPAAKFDLVNQYSEINMQEGNAGDSNFAYPFLLLNNNTSGGGTSKGSVLRFAKNGSNLWGFGSDYLANGSQNFWIYDYVASQPRLLIDSYGSVGIGMTSPSQKLDVAGNINLNTNGTAALFSTYKGASTDGFNIFIGGGGQSSQYNGSNSYTGSYNTSDGINALKANTTGYYNSAQGVNALQANTTGYYNSAQGDAALYSNTTGYHNSAVGFEAGYNDSVPLQTMTNSTFIGYLANSSVDGITNSTAIGNGAQVTASNQVVIGNGSVTQTLLNGSVGIGTAATGQILTIGGAGNKIRMEDANGVSWSCGPAITTGVFTCSSP